MNRLEIKAILEQHFDIEMWAEDAKKRALDDFMKRAMDEFEKHAGCRLSYVQGWDMMIELRKLMMPYVFTTVKLDEIVRRSREAVRELRSQLMDDKITFNEFDREFAYTVVNASGEMTYMLGVKWWMLKSAVHAAVH